MTRAEAAEAALRKVAEMPCQGASWLFYRVDCRGREAEAMFGRKPRVKQRDEWCPRCVAADAVEHLPE